ncbi:MAG: hypothetical protein IJU76_08635 [Desulfovibrionaceae bacterium]|nr:hypothetical protein [Desulfovibrionaceae bacterium]
MPGRKKTHTLSLRTIAFALFAFLLTACGPGNEIHLLPPEKSGESILPRPNAPTVTVVEFADSRKEKLAIGQRRDGSSFSTADRPTHWISHALADTLTEHGLMVSYAKSFDQARKANPDYIVSGKLMRVWLNETSATYIESIVETEFTLANREKHLLRENNKAQSSRGWPSSLAQTEAMIRDTMTDLIVPIAQKIADRIWKRTK